MSLTRLKKDSWLGEQIQHARAQQGDVKERIQQEDDALHVYLRTVLVARGFPAGLLEPSARPDPGMGSWPENVIAAYSVGGNGSVAVGLSIDTRGRVGIQRLTRHSTQGWRSSGKVQDFNDLVRLLAHDPYVELVSEENTP